MIKELDNQKKLVSEYVTELNELNSEHEQKIHEMAKELNYKGISLNKLNILTMNTNKK